MRFSAAYDVIVGALSDHPEISRVHEVGTASGDFTAMLAQEFPRIRFTGMDFSVDVATERFGDLVKVKFVRGYFLDDAQKLPGDLLFFISTATNMVPKELDRTFAAAKTSGFRYIVLSEPWRWNYRINRRSKSVSSVHMQAFAWGHNYPGYLSKNGYSVKTLKLLDEKPGVQRLVLLAEAKGHNLS